MNAEKIFKREDGKHIKIQVDLQSSYRGIDWRVDVTFREKGKKSWRSVYSGDDYFYRKLSMEERAKFVTGKQLEHCTTEEIKEVKKLVITEIEKTIN